ncbi:double-strand break repair helicase AddA [Yunchengibacter salinarum]|uniref:double-strand break repair helicase AddA n=1 Tax=Yunchengibacter salinarum TaxID=3133399 RepID=UPI0035B699F4
MTHAHDLTPAHVEARPRMTELQARATDPDLTAWVGASAGTGKTHVLTARVLRLMLTGTPPENILCLTFTKAAAAEMKSRIFQELGGWTVMATDTLRAELRRRTQEDADDTMLARARQLFAHVLDLPGGLRIQTFHSFCQSLLARFPLEAGIAPGFQAMEEAEADRVMAEARDRVLMATRTPAGAPLKAALDRLAGMVTEQDFDRVIGALSFHRGLLNGALRAYGNETGVIAAVYRALDVDQGDTPDGLEAAAMAEGAFDRAGIQALADAMATGSKTDQQKAADLHAFLSAGDAERSAAFEVYRTVFLIREGGPRKTVATKGVLTGRDDLADLIEGEQARLMRLVDRQRRLAVADASAALIRLGVAQLAGYDREKATRGVLDFDDMIGHAVGLLDMADLAPWVLFKLDGALDHILVDEAQDTNPDQWTVVEALVAEFFAGEGASDAVRTVFAVGDVKQSIFSFQKADPTHFMQAGERVFRRARGARCAAERLPLSLSFRSGAAVLGFVDAVFDAEGPAGYGLTLGSEEAVNHAVTRTGAAGRVSLWPLEAPRPAQPEEDEDAWAAPLSQERMMDVMERTARLMADEIAAMLREARPLEARGRPVRPGDIMVLVRRRGPFVDHLVRGLKQHGVPVAGRDRMVLTQELPVADLMALGRFALQSDDDLACAEVLKGPFVGVDEATLFRLAYGRSGSLWSAVRGDAALGPARDFLETVLSVADRLSPLAFYSHVLGPLGGRRRLAARLGEDSAEAVDEFLFQAQAFEQGEPASLQGFLHRMTMSGAEIKRDMEAAGDRVRVMTVHAAKGLQAPVVFLTDLTSLPHHDTATEILPLAPHLSGPPVPVWTREGRGIEAVDSAREEARQHRLFEYQRLLYVALTRAEDELILMGWEGQKPAVPDDCWYRLLEAGMERLDDRVTEVDGPGGRSIRRYDVPQTHPVSPERIGEEAAPPAPPMPAWVHAAAPTEPRPARPLTPSRPGGDDDPPVLSPLSRGGEDIRYRRGVLLHGLLEWLPDSPPDSRAALARSALARQAPDMPESERDAVWRELERLFGLPDAAHLFGPGSRAEVPVAGLVHGTPVSGQVDRLAVRDDAVWVVDYKTNRPPPDAVENVAPAYLRQMAFYRAALQAVYPGRAVHAGLLWTHTARLMWLPAPLLDGALPAFD